MRPVPKSMADRLAAAAQTFAELGFDQARITDVARSTGIPKATLYYYFTGKEEILVFLLRSLLDEVATAVTAAAEAQGNAAARLRGVVRAQLQVMASNPAASQLLVANVGSAGRLPDVALAIDASFQVVVRRLLTEGVADGSLRPVDPALGASVLFGAVVVPGLRDLVVDGELRADQLADEVLAMLLQGLAGEGRT